MKARQGESLFLGVDVNGDTPPVFGRPERLAERPGERNRSWNGTPSSLLVELGQSSSGYKIIEAFLPEAGA